MPDSQPSTAISHRRISILGATGSIGVNTLDVIRHMGGRDAFDVVAVTGSANVALLAKQAVEVGAEIAVTADERLYGELKERLAGTGGDDARAGLVGVGVTASGNADLLADDVDLVHQRRTGLLKPEHLGLHGRTGGADELRRQGRCLALRGVDGGGGRGCDLADVLSELRLCGGVGP